MWAVARTVVVIDFGTNDLSNKNCVPEDLADRIVAFARELLTIPSVAQVGIGLDFSILSYIPKTLRTSGCAKRKLLHQFGTTSQIFDTYLREFEWQENHKGHQQRLAAWLVCIRQQYP
ncbi:hypothetical protein NP493_288g03030 [Ridgeia piscesae]|uniref:Uncharacterized protein n=1 Tax=Ridgeia piscesae TaxID=27915 RepID=A0AAD9NWX0_RIDPI|nr:hypothetical protein NP493_288g03030 [Ridgeia piscesae]